MLPFEGIPDDLVPLTAHFKQLLTLATKEQPLLLFLDSVDQLTGTQDANKVSWLPTRLPPYCKVIRKVSIYVFTYKNSIKKFAIFFSNFHHNKASF